MSHRRTSVAAALAAVTAIVSPRCAPGEVIHEDLVRDPDIWDCKPLCWERVAANPGTYLPSPEGDGLDVRQTTAADTAVISEEVFAGNLCVRGRGTLNGNEARLLVALHVSAVPFKAYVCNLSARPIALGSPEFNITKWFEAFHWGERIPLGAVDPNGDYEWELCATGVASGVHLEARLWRLGPGEEAELVAEVAMDDSNDPYRSGSAGFGGFVAPWGTAAPGALPGVRPRHARGHGARLRAERLLDVAAPLAGAALRRPRRVRRPARGLRPGSGPPGRGGRGAGGHFGPRINAKA